MFCSHYSVYDYVEEAAMKKIVTLAVIMLFLLTLSAGTVSAKNDNVQRIDIPKEWQGKDQIITQKGDLVQVVWIKRVNDNKNPNDQVARVKPSKSNAYSLASYRWALSKYQGGVPYILNPTAMTQQGLTEGAVTQAVSGSFKAWNDATWAQSRPVKVFDGSPTINYGAQIRTDVANSEHVITWGELSDQNIIAMATMWYNRWTKELVDADMVFNTNILNPNTNTLYIWGIDTDGEGTGAALAANTFDIQNICTHEAGHWTSLNDMSASQYSSLTMYAYGSPQETLKISLAAGDLAGAQAAY